MSPAPEGLVGARPEMAREAAKLIEVARGLKSKDLRRLMDISAALADLNVARFAGFNPKGGPNDLPAAMVFAGDVYRGLRAREMSGDDLAFAQDHLRILSGLYGVLRPLDRIQPYRLEMGVRLATERGATLYDFWGDRPAKALNAAAAGHLDKTLVNLASQEYFGAVDARALKLPVLTCHFKEERDGEARFLSFYAKRARGLMARFAVLNRIERSQDLRAFDLEGYAFDSRRSTDGDWTFTREQPAGRADEANDAMGQEETRA